MSGRMNNRRNLRIDLKAFVRQLTGILATSARPLEGAQTKQSLIIVRHTYGYCATTSEPMSLVEKVA